jgi:glycosyltransferase involved in cell wall biosynthesis
MSTYDDAKYLDQSITAILNQSFKDFELIIVNDASPDHSDDIIRKYAHLDNRICYIKNSRNKGLVKNINACCQIAKGEYLYHASSDDWVCDDFFYSAVHYLDLYKASVCYLNTSYYFEEENKFLHQYKAIPQISRPQFFDKNAAQMLIKKNHYVATCSAIIKTDSFIKQGCYSEELPNYCDVIAFNFIAGTEGFVYVPQDGAVMRRFKWHEKKYSLPFKKKIKLGIAALDYCLKEQEKFKFFCDTLMLPRGLNYKFFPALLYPKYWSLAPRLIRNKLKLLPQKIGLKS